MRWRVERLLAEQAKFLPRSSARIYIAWNGATISLEDHDTLHAQWINEHPSFPAISISRRSMHHRAVRARDSLLTGGVSGRPPPNVIKAVVGEDWISSAWPPGR